MVAVNIAIGFIIVLGEGTILPTSLSFFKKPNEVIFVGQF